MKLKEWKKLMEDNGYKKVGVHDGFDVVIYDGIVGHYIYFRRKR